MIEYEPPALTRSLGQELPLREHVLVWKYVVAHVCRQVHMVARRNQVGWEDGDPASLVANENAVLAPRVTNQRPYNDSRERLGRAIEEAHR